MGSGPGQHGLRDGAVKGDPCFARFFREIAPQRFCQHIKQSSAYGLVVLRQDSLFHMATAHEAEFRFEEPGAFQMGNHTRHVH